MKNYSITQTHPNKGTISVNGVNHIFYTNSQIAIGISSNLPKIYECESLINERTKSMIKYDSIELMAEALINLD